MQTATNPQTGEKVVFQNGQWVPADSPQQTYPGVIPGVPDTMKDAKDAQDLTKGELDIRKSELDIQKRQQEIAEKELSTKLGKEAGFYLRAATAGPAFEELMIGPEGQFRATVGGAVPDNWLNNFTSEERQVAEAYMRDFAMASLRYESGAAIPPEEIKSQMRTFFPVAGDKPATVEAKRQLRKNLIESLKLGAGEEAAQAVDSYIATIPRVTPEEDRVVADPNPDEQGLPGMVTYEGPAQEMAADPNLSDGSLIDAIGTVGKQGITLGLSDEAAGVGGAIASVLTGNINNAAQSYRDNRDAERLRIEGARDRLGAAAIPLELAGAGGGIANVAGKAFGVAEGIGAGMLGGFGYGEGLQGSTTNALLGGAIGGGIARAGQAVGGALANRAANRASVNAPAVARAGQAENVTVNRAMVDPSTMNRVTRVDASKGGGGRIQREMRNIEGQVEGRVSDLGRGGQAMDDIATGDKVKGAAERFIDKSGKSAKVKYDRAEKLAGNAKVEPKQSLAVVDDAIATLKQTPETNAAEIKFLEGLKSDLSQDLSVGALRRMRTSLRKKISKGDLVFGEDEARVLSVMDAAADDIRAGLAAQGNAKAARAFDSADKAYRARMEYIDGTIQKLIGKRQANLSAEQIARKFNSMARNDARGLKKFYATLEPDEAADVAATFAERLGKNNKGDFSVAHFLSQTEKMSDEAIRTVFGPEGVQSVKNLQTLGNEINRVTSAMNSRKSGSGVAVGGDYRGWLVNTLLGGGLGFGSSGMTGAAVGAAAGAGAKVGADFLSARALMSPKITKWITQAPKTTNPKAIDAHFNKLAGIAKAEPALANEVEALRRGIMGAANDNLGAVAAEEPTE